MEQKIAFVKEMPVRQGDFAALCRRFGISRKTGYKWRRRFEDQGTIVSLEDRSRRPHHSPRRVDDELIRRIQELRAPDGWGARKIAYLLWEEGVEVSVATVHRTLLRRKMVSRLDKHAPAPERFERPEPNDLLQVDFKGPMGRGSVQDQPLTVLDDHSRFVLGLYSMADHSLERVRERLVIVFEKWGCPRQMLFDHGTPWWSTSNGWGLSRLSVFLMEHNIELIFGRVAHPQTQGKVERFHRTLHRSMMRQGVPAKWEQWQGRYDGFVERYNHHRPHEALGMQRPVQRYRPSPRAYQDEVAPWIYPEGLGVKRVDANGMIRVEGRRCFVCEALTGHQVATEQIGQQILVRFRHMYVRELNLRDGSSQGFIHPVSRLAAKT